MKADAQHLGIRRIQDLFVEKADRMCQWATDRRVPSDNNRTEWELRPTVIARKVSFGSPIRSRGENKRSPDERDANPQEASQ